MGATGGAEPAPATDEPHPGDAEEQVEEALAIDGDGDGRSMRRRRNRDAVIAALISLIRGGDLEPSVGRIADVAGVSHRSVFRYFEDLNDLARTAIETELRDALPDAIIPDVGQGSLPHRIDQMLASRMRLCERTHSLARAARAKSVEIPEIDRGLALANDMMRDQIDRHFRVELAAMDENQADYVTTALAVLLSIDGYDLQHRLLDLTTDEVRSVWRISIERLLTT